jgi:hypothetical protein
LKIATRKALFAASALFIVATAGACGSNSDTAPIVAAAIAITAPNGAIPVDGTMQFAAVVTDANGNTITVTPTWTLVNGGGTITTGGLFTAGDSVGTFTNTIVATIGSISSASTVIVSAGALASIAVAPDTITLQVGGTHQYAAIGHDAHGHVVAIPARVWSAATAAGTIDTSGLFTAGTTAGTTVAAVTATSGSISGTAQVIVSPGALATITVAPDTAALDQGATQQFTAVGTDAHGNVVAITPTWDAGVGGSITSTGLYTASNIPGTYPGAVTATVALVVGSATVIVNPGPLYSIEISPFNPLLAPGSTQQFTAIGHDADGYIVPITPVWSIAAASSGAGTISPTGLFTASFAPNLWLDAIVATSGQTVGTTSVAVFNINPCSPFWLTELKRRPALRKIHASCA